MQNSDGAMAVAGDIITIPQGWLNFVQNNRPNVKVAWDEYHPTEFCRSVVPDVAMARMSADYMQVHRFIVDLLTYFIGPAP